ncbi:MAG: hypothetical protein EBU96_05105 [Actinobacteria bacterium]|nr:hypothetical protein [Actinomycetota bacterium]
MAENPSGEKPLQTSPETSPSAGVTSSQPREDFWAAATAGGDIEKALAQEAGVETSKPTETKDQKVEATAEVNVEATAQQDQAEVASEDSKPETEDSEDSEEAPSRVRLNLKNMGENSRKAALLLKQGVPIEDIARVLVSENKADQEEAVSEDFEDPQITDAQENLRIAGEELAELTKGVEADYDIAKIAKLGPTLKKYLDAQNDLRKATDEAVSNRNYEAQASKSRERALAKFPEAGDPESPLRLMVIGLWNKASDKDKSDPSFIETVTEKAASLLSLKPVSDRVKKDVSTPPPAKAVQKAQAAKVAPHATPVSGSATTSVAPKTSDEEFSEALSALLGSDKHLVS